MKLKSWSVSTQMSWVVSSYSTPKRSVVSPSRLTSPPISLSAVMDSLNRLKAKLPAGAVHVEPEAMKVGPLTLVSIARQVASPSSSGSVEVTQSTILRSPVVVVASAGWSRSTPESRMPTVMPRPSYVRFLALNLTAPVSFVGMYGLASGVRGPGAWMPEDEPPPLLFSSRGSGCLMLSLRSIFNTLARPAALATESVATVART